MELFSITCTTCRKRLKVLDAATIGQIAICPHCGSMVLVAPPAPEGDAADEVAAQEAAPTTPTETEAASPPLAVPAAAPPIVTSPALAAELPQFRQSPAGSPAYSSVADAPTADLSEPQAAPDVAAVSETAAPDASGVRASGAAVASTDTGATHGGDRTAAPVAASPGFPDEPSAKTAEEATTSGRHEGLMIGGAAAAGLALALGVFGIVAAWNSSSSPTVSLGPGPESATPATSAKSENDTRDPGVPAVSNSSPPETTGAAPSASVPPLDASALPGPQTDPDAVPATTPQPAKPLEMPETSDAAGTTTKPPVTLGVPAATDTTGVTPGFGSFAPFMDSTLIAPAQPASESGLDKPAEPVSAAGPPELPGVPRPAPRHVDVAQRLKDEIPSIEFSQTPLLDLLQFLASFSTIPITLDPDALALVKATPQIPVSVKLEKTNVDQVLTAALEPLRLGYVVTDDQLLVTLVTKLPQRQIARRKHKHSVQDLVGDDSRRLGQLTDLIVAMVEPESWEVHGGAGVLVGEMPSLMIEQRDTVLFRTLLFCDKLRVARGLPPQSGFSPEVFKLTPRSALAAKTLATRVTLNYPIPTLLVRILDQLRKDTGVHVLVDWQAVAELGWNPDAETTLAAHDQTLGEALESLLRPLELAYRVIDGQTLEITTPARLGSRLEVEFYPAGPLLPASQTPEPLIERIRGELGLQVSAPAVPRAVFYFDPPSKYLVAALPQPQQRRLAELLAQWQTK